MVRGHLLAASLVAVSTTACLGTATSTHHRRGPVAVPWIDSPVRIDNRFQPMYVQPGSDSAPRCTSAELTPARRMLAQGASLQLVFAVNVLNRGRRDCTLRGVPHIRMAAADGRVIRTIEHPDHSLLVLPRWHGYPIVALRPGQTASVVVLWGNGCRGGPAARLQLDWGTGQLWPEFAGAAKNRSGGPCLSWRRPGMLAVGPFTPEQAPQSSAPPPEVDRLRISVLVPPAIRRGTGLPYRVFVRNFTAAPFRFTGCPAYWQGLRRPGSYRQPPYGWLRALRLNCGRVGTIAPGAGVTFAMRLTVPARLPTGRWRLVWGFVQNPEEPGQSGAALIRVLR